MDPDHSTITANNPLYITDERPSFAPVTPPPGQWFEIPVNAAPESVVRMVGPDTRLPDNSLFRTHPQPGATYLVETDPRFTNNKKWLSSDYMQSAFTANHDNMHKRLGDGYYEQRLIREQIIALTGGRYTGGHRNDEAQFRALMDAGIAFGKRYDLIPGVALSADQMRLLTTDIVWLVNTRVKLADGSWQTVMVPQVYVRVKPGDIDGSGALLGGQNVVMNLNSDLLNSGTIGGREEVQISAENIINKAGTIQGADISLLARLDIHNTGGDISAAHSLLASAGRDINVESVTRSAQNSSGKNTFTRINIERVGGIYVQGEDGKLSLSAGRDINLTGAQVAHTGKQGQTFLSAGQDLNLNTVTTSASDSLVWNSRNWMKHAVTQQTGTDITAAGSVQMAAGNDVNAQAARVSAGDILAVAAGRDINITAATDHSEFEARHKYSSRSGAFSKTTTRTHDALSRDSAQGSRFSGDSVAMQAGNDLWVQGSDIAGERGVNLSAAHDISTAAATETASHFHSKKTKKSGISSGGSGFSFTVGSTSTKSTHKGGETTQSESRSTIGAAAGNVVISAGNKAILSATDVVAGRAQDDTQRKTGHIDITADHIGLFPGQDSITRSVQQETKSSGLTLTLKAPFEDTVRNVHDALRGKDSGGNSTVDKVKSLAAEGVALTMDGAGSPFAVSVGRSQSSSASHYQGEFRHGSHLRAAGNIQMNAGDITAEGGKLQAGEAVILDAERDIHITASTDQENRSSKNNHSGWSLSSSMPTAGSAVRATSGGGKHASQLLPGGMSHSDSQSSGASSTQAPAVIEGSDIYLNSQKGDISISGSRLFADNDLFLSATQGNIRTQAGQQRSQYQASGGNRSVGSLGGDGYSATAGYSRETWRNHEEAQLGNSLRSTLTSAHGNVVAQAGSDISLSGTDVLAGKSLSVSGQNVDLGVSRDTRSADSRHNSEQYGVTASAGGWAVDAAKSAEHAARSVENDDDPRLAAIRAGQAAATATQGALSDSAVVKARASVTAGRSAQNSTSQSTQAQGTTLTAREDVTISARQDISGQGAGIHGRRVALEAGRDIRFDASRNTQHHESRSQGSQAGIGIGVGLIGAQNGISIEAGASRQSSRAQADALTHHNSVIRADELLTVNSGRDTTLSGTRLAGDRVVMQTGRDLTVSSLPDTASSDSRQRASGAAVSLCIPPLCYGASSGNLTASGENIDHRAQSVAEQSAILAGRGGFDIRVGGHTQLDGALIASTAAPAKNRLDTATLGWADIRNDSKTSGDSYSLALSASAGGNNRNLSPATGTGHADQAHSGITTSAISQGDIVIRDNARQTQDIASLSRDTDSTHQRVDIHGDVHKVRDNLAVQSEGMASGLSALDAWGKYTQQQAQQENAALASRLASEGTLDGMDTVQREALLKSHPDYRSTDYGPGSAFHTQGSAAIGLLAGAFGGNIQAGAAAGAAPLLASLVKNVDNATARAALHGMVAAALTQMKGGSAKDGMAAGAAGAATASLLAERLVGALYDKPVDQLTADEKRLVSSLITLAGAGAGYTAGGDISLAATGADSARVEVENNALSDIAEQQAFGESPADKLDKLNKAEEERFRREECAGLNPDACGAKLYDQRREALKDMASLGVDFLPIAGDIKGFAEAESAIDYLAAIIGIFPGLGDGAGKALKAAEKALAKGDLDTASTLINKASDDIAGSIVNTGSPVNLDEVNRLKYDPHAGKNKLAEGSAATELQNSLGGKLERVDPDVSGADFIFTSGPNKGKTVDFMFTTAKGSAKEIEGMNKFFDNNWDKNIEQLHTHLNKADIVPLDFRNLTPANQQRLLGYINKLPTQDKSKIVIMR